MSLTGQKEHLPPGMLQQFPSALQLVPRLTLINSSRPVKQKLTVVVLANNSYHHQDADHLTWSEVYW